MKKMYVAFLLAVVVGLLAAGTVLAQNEELILKMSRDWGYGGFNNDIQGLFSMKVTGPADLARVEYYVDSTKIGEVTQAPFNLQFSTDDHPLGIHQLYAVGYSSSGQEYRSNVITVEFVPEQDVLKFLLPVLGVIVVAILLSTLVPLLTSRGKRLNLPLGTERHYGLRGGAICPKCQRPFTLPFFSANLGFSKLAACPFCGRFGLVRVESSVRLRQAEKAELAKAQPDQPVSGETEDEKLKKDLDNSKYQGT